MSDQQDYDTRAEDTLDTCVPILDTGLGQTIAGGLPTGRSTAYAGYTNTVRDLYQFVVKTAATRATMAPGKAFDDLQSKAVERVKQFIWSVVDETRIFASLSHLRGCTSHHLCIHALEMEALEREALEREALEREVLDTVPECPGIQVAAMEEKAKSSPRPGRRQGEGSKTKKSVKVGDVQGGILSFIAGRQVKTASSKKEKAGSSSKTGSRKRSTSGEASKTSRDPQRGRSLSRTLTVTPEYESTAYQMPSEPVPLTDDERLSSMKELQTELESVQGSLNEQENGLKKTLEDLRLWLAATATDRR